MSEAIDTTNSNPRRGLITLLIAGLLIILEVAGNFRGVTTPTELLELSARDMSFRLRGTQPYADEIVIVAIDDASLNWVSEQWPWPRARIAEIINWLNEAGAALIALDVFLFDNDPNPENDEALIEALDNAKLSLSVNQIFGDGSLVTHNEPLPVYQEVLDGFGITEIDRDDDAIVRGVTAYNTFRGDEIYFHWAFEVVRLYKGIAPPREATPESLTFDGNKIPLNQQRLFLVDYAGPAETYPTYSAAFLPLGDIPPENFKDKIVLIGATSETLQDLYPTPFSATTLTPGVEVVANAVATLLSGNYLRIAPPWVTILLIVVSAFIAWETSRIPRPKTALLTLLAVMVSYFIFRFLVFSQWRWDIALVGPELMLLLGVVTPNLEQAVTHEIEKRRVRSLFSRFVSPEIVAQILEAPNIESLNKRTELTILFADIRGFTALAERLKPEEVVALLNPYLNLMSEVIHQHGGTVDKYEGDAIIAFFGEPIPFPDHAKRAVQAALDMRRALETLTSRWRREAIFLENFEIGIGINTGDVFVGLIGAEQRVNYTVIGDNVNLTARLQDQTKELNWPILISASTYEQIKDEFHAEFVDSRIMKGKTEAVSIYKLIGAREALPSEWVRAYGSSRAMV
jgi:adenylate cyclase